MKKRNIKDLFTGIIIGGLIFGGMGVSAITLTANQVKYTPNNEYSTATNAQEAIDDLYTMTEDLKKGKLTLVGTTTSFNITDIVGAENVGKYSADDFVVRDNLTTVLESGTLNVTYNAGSVRHMNHKISLVKDFEVIYDNTNGDVTINNKELKVAVTCIALNAAGYENQYYTVESIMSISPKVYLSL